MYPIFTFTLKILPMKTIFILGLLFVVSRTGNSQDLSQYTFLNYASTTQGTFSDNINTYTATMNSPVALDVDILKTNATPGVLPTSLTNAPSTIATVNAIKKNGTTYRSKIITFDKNLPQNTLLFIQDLDINEDIKVELKDDLNNLVNYAGNTTILSPPSGLGTETRSATSFTLKGPGVISSEPVYAIQLLNANIKSIEISLRDFSNGNIFFYIAIPTANALPIELLSFKGRSHLASSIYLNWTTAMESNNQGFHVEYSLDGQNWEEIAYIKGQGNSLEKQQYNFVHEHPISKQNYYRLKQVDFDKKVTYHEVIMVQKEIKTNLSIYPNPTSGALYINTSNTARTSISIYDVLGNLIEYRQELRQPLIDLSAYPRGVYYLQARIENKQFTRKVVVN